MTTRQTPDAVREALEQRKAINTVLGRLLAPLVPDVVERIRIGNDACTAILAALDSRAVDAGEAERIALAVADTVEQHLPSPAMIWGLPELPESWMTELRSVLVASLESELSSAPAVDANKDTVAFVQEWLLSGDYPADTWTHEFAAAIDARCQSAVDAAPAGEVGFDPATFGESVLKAMAGRTCREVAKEVGVSPATLNRVTRGQMPDLPTYLAITAWMSSGKPAALSHGEGRK